MFITPETMVFCAEAAENWNIFEHGSCNANWYKNYMRPSHHEIMFCSGECDPNTARALDSG